MPRNQQANKKASNRYSLASFSVDWTTCHHIPEDTTLHELLKHLYIT